MPTADEMRSQPQQRSAADAADDDIVVLDEETAVKEPAREPWAPGGESSSAPATGTEPDRSGPTAAGEPGSMPPPGAGEAGGGSAVSAGAPGSMRPAEAGEAGGAPAPGDRGPWTGPPSAGYGEGAGGQAAGDAASMPAGASRTAPSGPRDDRLWREIQGMFVDDPRDSVQRASDLIDTVIGEFLAAVRQRQAALASSWQNREADTEALRCTLKDYRALWAVVRDLPAVGAPGGAAAASAGADDGSLGAGPGSATGANEPGRGGTPS